MSNVQIDKELIAHQPTNNQKLNNNKLTFKYQSRKLILLYLCYILCNPKAIFAHQVNMNITGFSYHMGNWSYPEMLREGSIKMGILYSIQGWVLVGI